MKGKLIVINLSDIQVGDVILFHTPFSLVKPMSWLSAAIRWFTNDYYSHASIVSKNEQGNLTLVQALENGINSDTLVGQILNCDVKIIAYNTNKSLFIYEETALINRINSKIGTPYDFVGLLLDQPILQIGEKIDPNSELWLGRKNASKFECATFAAWCLQYPDWWAMAPSDFDKATDFFTTIAQGIISKIN